MGVDVFRRRNRIDDEALDTELDDEPDDPTDDAAATSTPWSTPTPARPSGPWDSADAPADDVDRLDLGSLHVPVPDGLEVRVEVQDDVVVAATFVDVDSTLQIHVFAAPKSSGVWDEVRDEIASSLRSSAGSAEYVNGPFGAELAARVPDEGAPGTTVPARFLGVDGPRWFLRGLLTGPAATVATRAQALESAFRAVVVHRGPDAIAPRDLLPLHLPREALAAIEQQADETADQPSLSLPERGPEITEIQ